MQTKAITVRRPRARGIEGRVEVMKVFDPTKGKPPVSQAGTFTANPLSMVAGAAAMRAMQPAAFDRLNALGDYARRRITGAIRAARVPGQVTGAGSLFRIFLKRHEVWNYRTAYADQGERQRLSDLIRFLREHGVILSNIGLGALSTPMMEGDIDRFSDLLEHGLLCLVGETEHAGTGD